MTPREEIAQLAIYFEGMADAMASQPVVSTPPDARSHFSGLRLTPAQRILSASRWLAKLSGNVCGQGFVGCNGGDRCCSDHK